MIITQTQTESALIKREDAAKYLGVSDKKKKIILARSNVKDDSFT